MPRESPDTRESLRAREAQIKAEIAERTAILQDITSRLAALESGSAMSGQERAAIGRAVTMDPLSRAMAEFDAKKAAGQLPAPTRLIRGADGKLMRAPTAPPGVYSVPTEDPRLDRPGSGYLVPGSNAPYPGGASGPGWSPVTTVQPGGSFSSVPRDYRVAEPPPVDLNKRR